MKATLEFTMPEDRVEHALALRGPSFAFALTNLDNTLRNALKHGHHFETADHALADCRNQISDAVQIARDCYDL